MKDIEKREKELAKAKEIFRKYGYAGKYVYIPLGTKKRGSVKEKILELTQQGYNPTQIAEKLNTSILYVLRVRKKST